MQAGGNRGGGKDESRASKLAYIRVFVRACVFAAPTSEALTRPSWKEQLEGSWVHKLRYLHQWQRKALFTHDRHLDAHRPTEGQSQEKAAQSRTGSAFAKVPQRK